MVGMDSKRSLRSTPSPRRSRSGTISMRSMGTGMTFMGAAGSVGADEGMRDSGFKFVVVIPGP